jgi:hypothetical protein
MRTMRAWGGGTRSLLGLFVFDFFFVFDFCFACSHETAFFPLIFFLFFFTPLNDRYIGSLEYPYFSDTGRDKPGYYVFAVGLTISGVLLAAVTVLNWARIRHLAGGPDAVGRAATAVKLAAASAVCGVLSAPFLATLAIADTVNYPTAHNLGAYAFFFFAVISATLATVASFKIDDGTLAKVKLGIVSFMWVFVIIYLPVGLGLTCEWKRLTIAKCEALGLGNTYCTDTVKLNDTETKLWDYSECSGINTMRSVSQLLSVLSLLAFFGSHSLDFRKALRGGAIRGSDGF